MRVLIGPSPNREVRAQGVGGFPGPTLVAAADTAAPRQGRLSGPGGIRVDPGRAGALLYLCCAFILCACASQPLTVTREPVSVRIVAADSAGLLAEELAAAYEAAHPWVTVEVAAFNSSEAEAVLREGAADLALLSWMRSDPGGSPLWSTPFRRDAVSVVLHPSTRLPGSSLGYLQEVFRGRIQEREDVVLVVVSREEGSGTRAAFEETVMGYHPVTLNSVVVPSSRAVLDTVASTPGAIGYVSTLRISPEDLDKLVVLLVEGIAPVPESIADGSYPLARQLYVAALSEPVGAVRDLAQWVLGPEGQAVTARFESATGVGT